MLDLRMVLWFIFGAVFAVWSFILVFRVSILWKQFLIASGIWLIIIIIQASTKDITMPAVRIFPEIINAYPSTKTLYNWFPSFVVTYLPISVWIFIHHFKKYKNIKNNETENNGNAKSL